MKHRFLQLISIICVVVLIGSVSASAINSTSATSSLNCEIKRIDFVEGITYNSTELRNIIDSISTDVSQVVFSLDTGTDIVTIGYLPGSLGFSYALMEEKICNIVSSIDTTEMISNISKNTADPIETLELRSLYMVSEPSATTDQLVDSKIISYVEDVRSVASEISNVTCMYETSASDGFPFEIMPLATSTAIDGSYHFKQVLDDETYTMWHNQITDSNSCCNYSATSPHAGDGNNRYRNGSGYKWFPNNVQVTFYTDTPDSGENQTVLKYKYTQTSLNYLVHDSNEALEMEVLFYNEGNTGNASTSGTTFQNYPSNEGSAWASNQPEAYLDTTFGDSDEAVSFCVGVPDASNLSSNKWYYWIITGESGTQSNNFVNDGRFKVIAQRSYKTFLPGTWGVFSEEHEPAPRLGMSSGNWLPGVNAWDLAESGNSWTFNSSTDPVKIPS